MVRRLHQAVLVAALCTSCPAPVAPGSDSGEADLQVDASGHSDAALADGSSADLVATDRAGLDAGSLDVVGRDSGAADASASDSAVSDARASDSAFSDGSASDSAAPDSAAPDAAALDTAAPDAAAVDTNSADAAGPDAAVADGAGHPDTAVADAPIDASGSDGAPADRTVDSGGLVDGAIGCGPGYAESDGGCVDIDECLTSTHGCISALNCDNTAGSHRCICAAGEIGDGLAGGVGCRTATLAHVWTSPQSGWGTLASRTYVTPYGATRSGAGNLYLTGSHAGSYSYQTFGFGVGLSGSTGTATWVDRFGWTYAFRGTDIVVDSQSRVTIYGTYEDGLYFNSIRYCCAAGTNGTYGIRPDDVFLARYTSGGSQSTWSNYGSDGDEWAARAILDSSGTIVMSGHFRSGISFNSNSVSTADTDGDGFVGKLGFWTVARASSAVDGCDALAVASNDDVLAVCVVAGRYQVYRLAAATGSEVWATTLPYSMNGTPIGTVAHSGLAVAGADLFVGASWSNRYTAGGTLDGSAAGGGGVAVVRLDLATGVERGRFELDGSDIDRLRGLQYSPDGALLVAGTFRGDLDLGQGVVTAQGASDIFLAVVALDGQVATSATFGTALVDDVFDAVLLASDRVALVGGAGGGLSFGGATLGDPASYLGYAVLFSF